RRATRSPGTGCAAMPATSRTNGPTNWLARGSRGLDGGGAERHSPRRHDAHIVAPAVAANAAALPNGQGGVNTRADSLAPVPPALPREGLFHVADRHDGGSDEQDPDHQRTALYQRRQASRQPGRLA